MWFANNAGLYADRKKGLLLCIRTNNLSGKGYAVVLNVAVDYGSWYYGCLYYR